jgi:hypothetical protein
MGWCSEHQSLLDKPRTISSLESQITWRDLEQKWGKPFLFDKFSCVSYVHIDFDARDKLDSKSWKCLFIGYADEAFGYGFWDDQNLKIIRSINVIFSEQAMYKDMSTAKSDVIEPESKKFELVNLDKLSEGTMQDRDHEVEENAYPQVEQGTPITAI